MFKKSRKKIVATIMSILVLLWVGTLGITYASSYMEVTRRNKDMLKTHAAMYVLPGEWDAFPSQKPLPNVETYGFHPGNRDSQMFQLTVFYTVALTYDGKILDTRNQTPTVHTDEELEELAQTITEGKKTTGTEQNLVFYQTDKGGYRLVVFMDNTVLNESVSTLFRYTLLFGALALVMFFLLSVFLARKIVQPLEESYQKQKQFISDAGHELKTPVAVVGTNAELLEREIGVNPWLSNIRYENERMGMLVGQLLELARTESVAPQMERIDFSRLVGGETLPFESVAYEKGLLLNSEIEKGIFLEGNADQLKQLVAILVDNGIRHSMPGGTVSLHLSQEHGYAKLSVINQGKEIPNEQREQIFERFYRVDTARNGEEKHYGLGLAIAKAIVTSHHGKVEVLCYQGLVEFQVCIEAC